MFGRAGKMMASYVIERALEDLRSSWFLVGCGVIHCNPALWKGQPGPLSKTKISLLLLRASLTISVMSPHLHGLRRGRVGDVPPVSPRPAFTLLHFPPCNGHMLRESWADGWEERNSWFFFLHDWSFLVLNYHFDSYFPSFFLTIYQVEDSWKINVFFVIKGSVYVRYSIYRLLLFIPMVSWCPYAKIP